MCELCASEEWYEEAPVPTTDEELECEFPEDEDAALCGAPAEYEYRERYVDEHLCEHHAQEYAEFLGQGLMELLQQAGVASGETLKPIVARIECDRCSEPARYANVTMASTLFCALHRGWGAVRRPFLNAPDA